MFGPVNIGHCSYPHAPKLFFWRFYGSAGKQKNKGENVNKSTHIYDKKRPTYALNVGLLKIN